MAFPFFTLLVLLSVNCSATKSKATIQSQIDFDAAMSKANELYKVRKYDSAYYYIQEAISINPKSEQAYFQRALIKQKLDSLESANDDYLRAIAIQPRPVYYNNLGLNKAIKQRFKEAIACYDKAIELDAKYSQAWFNRAVAYFYLGELDKGCSDAQKAKELGLVLSESFIISYCN